MNMGENNNQADSHDSNRSETFLPSWIDRFNHWVKGKPWPSWTVYLGIGLVLIAVQVLVLWVEGVASMGASLAVQGFLAGAIAYLLGMFHLLDDKAGEALATLRPLLKTDEGTFHELNYRLTTLPARPTLLVSLIGIAGNMLLELVTGPYTLESLASYPISRTWMRIVYFVCWGIMWAFMYHTVNQLRQINRVYTQYARVDLCRIELLYAFSGVTALTAVSLTVCPYGFMLVNGGMLGDPSSLGYLLLMTALALVAFLWPLTGVRRLVYLEKMRALEEATRRFRAAFDDLHRRVDEKEFAGTSDLNMAIMSLDIEIKSLQAIPTWPWQPDTMRWLLSALLLPLILWVIQAVLQSVLGG
jgi:hypothetical protein